MLEYFYYLRVEGVDKAGCAIRYKHPALFSILWGLENCHRQLSPCFDCSRICSTYNVKELHKTFTYSALIFRRNRFKKSQQSCVGIFNMPAYNVKIGNVKGCLLYTSDAADE